MNVNFNGYNENAATFLADSTVSSGIPVKMKENGTVQACTSGDGFCGVALNVRDGYAAVQLEGYVSLPCSGEVPVGYQFLTAGAGGSIAKGTSGNKYLVIESTADSIGFIL